jgi:hypothetical protein
MSFTNIISTYILSGIVTAYIAFSLGFIGVDTSGVAFDGLEFNSKVIVVLAFCTLILGSIAFWPLLVVLMFNEFLNEEES